MTLEKQLALVSGATGKQGGALARRLLAAGFPVRATTRKPQSDKARALAELGAQVVVADFDDPASLERALDGAWGAYSVQDPRSEPAAEVAQGQRFAELARRAGVELFVYGSAAGAHHPTDVPIIESKAQVESTVRALGFPFHAIVRPVFFMDNFATQWFWPGLREGKLLLGLRPETVLRMAAVDDVADLLFHIFREPETFNRAEIDVAGDARTPAEIAALLGAALGRPVEFVPVPLAEIRLFSPDYALLLDWLDHGGCHVDVPELARRYGLRLKTLAEWARDAPWPARVTA